MNCPIYRLQSNTEFLKAFNQRIYADRIPVNGGMDLTERCNLNCIHCYIRKPAGTAKDLPAKKIKTVLDEAAKAGCLFFLMTGGEPLIRKDFADIYVHAVKLGMLVTVFSNGTLIDAEMAKLFRKLPPQNVEISIYGATAETHDRITGVKGSFDKTMKGIWHLLKNGVSTGVKTMLMKNNIHEFEGMLSLAGRLGVKFRIDAELFPRFNGDKVPVDMRVDPEVAVEKEMKLPGRKKEWREFFSRMRGLPVNNDLYECSAGRSYFHINAHGILRPCLMTTDIGYDLKKGSFVKGWGSQVLCSFNDKPAVGFVCRKCKDRFVCDTCPSFFMLENGNKTSYSKYMCKIAKERMRAVGGTI